MQKTKNSPGQRLLLIQEVKPVTYEAIIFKKVCYRLKDKNIDQWKRSTHSETDPLLELSPDLWQKWHCSAARKDGLFT